MKQEFNMGDRVFYYTGSRIITGRINTIIQEEGKEFTYSISGITNRRREADFSSSVDSLIDKLVDTYRAKLGRDLDSYKDSIEPLPF